MKSKLLLIVVLVVLFVAACGPTSSDISVQKAWARPALMSAPASMDMTEEAPMGDMSGMDMTEEAPMNEMEMSGGGANLTGAFMLIENKGGQADKLISAKCDAAGRVEIHQTTLENDIARMSPVDAIEIPANSTVELRPGGYHIMLMDLKRDLMAGETVAITLTFESGKEVTVEATIQETAP